LATQILKNHGGTMNCISKLFYLLVVGLLFAGTPGCDNSSFNSMLRDQDDSLRTPNPVPLTIWHESYESAVEESQRTGKPILADFTGSDWCHWCVKLKQDVFETSTFGGWAHDNVVLLELDYPQRGMQSAEIKQQNEELAQRYGISSYPTVLFLTADGEVIGRSKYMKDPSDWIADADSKLGNGVQLASSQNDSVR
jgi:protein disulfide-isomerase